MNKPEAKPVAVNQNEATKTPEPAPKQAPKPVEIGGSKGPEPTRYGDWEHKGRCSDF